MPLSTVSGILTRIGLGKLSRLEPPEPANRYERQRPGELIHIDIKKLGRIEGGAGHRITANRGLGQRSRGARMRLLAARDYPRSPTPVRARADRWLGDLDIGVLDAILAGAARPAIPLWNSSPRRSNAVSGIAPHQAQTATLIGDRSRSPGLYFVCGLPLCVCTVVDLWLVRSYSAAHGVVGHSRIDVPSDGFVVGAPVRRRVCQ